MEDAGKRFFEAERFLEARQQAHEIMREGF